MRVAIYIRVSTDEQATKGNSLTEQAERLPTYCKAMGWDPPVVYEDDGYSAKDLNRPAITRLLEDVKLRKYDMVLTTKIDRLSRRLLDLLNVIDYMKKYDCHYNSATESFDTSTPVGMMTLQILGSVAEFERQRIRERVRENHLSLARQGKMIGKPAYGYDNVDGDYEINIEESLIVKQIFQWTLDGMGPLSIAKKLNQLGVATKQGAQWEEKQIRRMLTSETYIGHFVYNRTGRDSSTAKVSRRPQEEWIVTEDHHPAIIDQETYDRVQEIVQSRRRDRHGFHGHDRYLLSGLVYCGHCGHKMHGRQRTRPRKTMDTRFEMIYSCSGYSKRGVCHFHFINRDDLENFVLSSLQEIARQKPEKLQLVLTEPVQQLSEKDLIMSKLAKLDTRMQKQIEAYERDAISIEDLKKARERIDKERMELHQSLQALNELHEAAEQIGTHSVIKDRLDDILSMDRVKAKQALATILHKIHIENGSEVSLVFKRLSHPDIKGSQRT
ncbi:recombinase family protein [Gorillibacterium sp. sgz5001074]|uniref:recombinase family protein n=1 Tax=Gorillibacterium sp. sgz5001074 TaxID=3446695 RepID=UPI003F676BE7